MPSGGGGGSFPADPGADRLLFWDDSDGAVEWAALADITDEPAPAAGDYLLIYGAEGDLRRVDWDDLPGAGGGISNVVEDTTPELGGDLETNNFDIKFEQFSADAVDAEAIFQKSRNAAIGSHTIVQDDDLLGTIRFQGSNGTTFDSAALIMAEVDGTPGATTDMPGRVSVWTTPDDSATPERRVTVLQNGEVIVSSEPVAAIFEEDAPLLQVLGTESTSAIGSARFSADGSPPRWKIGMSRSDTIGAQVIVQDGDELGALVFNGSDGVVFRPAAEILVVVDGTPSGTVDEESVPGRIVLSTTSEGDSGPSERMSADAAGNVVIGTDALATDATDGFLYVPGTEGVPTGTPTTYDGRSPVVADLNNNQLYFYTNSAWQSPREKLLANRTYYVRTDGSDSNTGLVDSAGGAFLTIQRAVDVVYGLDWSIYTPTIDVGDGTYTAGVVINGPNPGPGTLQVVGNTGTPANVHVDLASGICFEINNLAVVDLSGFKTTTTEQCLVINERAVCQFDLWDFGEADKHLVVINATCKTASGGEYTISGDADRHWQLDVASYLYLENTTITLTGTPDFGSSFAEATFNSIIRLDVVVFIGAATGQRYSVELGAIIFADGNTLPGDSAGVGTNFGVDPWGLYVDDPGGFREVLTAARTYYVRADGSDSNTGLVDSAGGAFLTIQHAVDVVYGLDWSIYDVTIDIGNGTYTAITNVFGPNPGSGTFTLMGDAATPSNVVIDVPHDDLIFVDQMASIEIGGLKFNSNAGGGTHLRIKNNSRVRLAAPVEFGICDEFHIRIDGGHFFTNIDYTISGNAQSHLSLEFTPLGSYTSEDNTITLTDTPEWTDGAFVVVSNNSVASFDGVTFTGSAVGSRYDVKNGGVVNSGGSTLPGDAAGSGTDFGTSPYGLYVA
jgi:hypothetical protein